MASRDATIRAIEVAAKAAYPGKSQMDQRFAERNRLRAAAGLPREKATRGGVAGAYDRNKNVLPAVAGIVAGAVLPATVPFLTPVLRASGLTPQPVNLTPQPSLPMQQFTGGAVMPVLTAAGRTATATVGSTILTGLINRFLPPPPPSFGPQTPIPQPKEGALGRFVSRVLPGGMTGREWTPVNDMTDRVGRPLAVYPAEQSRVVGPSGYVMVTMNGERIAMLRAFAIRAGLYKAPPKPPLSGYDMRAITRAASASKRVKKLAGKVGFRCEKKGTSRAAARPFGKKR